MQATINIPFIYFDEAGPYSPTELGNLNILTASQVHHPLWNEMYSPEHPETYYNLLLLEFAFSELLERKPLNFIFYENTKVIIYSERAYSDQPLYFQQSLYISELLSKIAPSLVLSDEIRTKDFFSMMNSALNNYEDEFYLSGFWKPENYLDLRNQIRTLLESVK